MPRDWSLIARRAGLDIRLVFTDVRGDVTSRTNGAQTPETSDSLNGRFMFKKAGPGVAASPPVVPRGLHPNLFVQSLD
jgi:hypothetical protein